MSGQEHLQQTHQDQKGILGQAPLGLLENLQKNLAPDQDLILQNLMALGRDLTLQLNLMALDQTLLSQMVPGRDQILQLNLTAAEIRQRTLEPPQQGHQGHLDPLQPSPQELGPAHNLLVTATRELPRPIPDNPKIAPIQIMSQKKIKSRLQASTLLLTAS